MRKKYTPATATPPRHVLLLPALRESNAVERIVLQERTRIRRRDLATAGICPRRMMFVDRRLRTLLADEARTPRRMNGGVWTARPMTSDVRISGGQKR